MVGNFLTFIPNIRSIIWCISDIKGDNMKIETVVNNLVNEQIASRHDLNIEHLAHVLDIRIGFNDDISAYMRAKGMDVIFIKRTDRYTMWSTFCHELGHMLLHSTRQLNMPQSFNDYQEFQANKFAILLMMPEALILKHKIYDANVASIYFDVPFEIALRRLEMLSATLKI